MARFWRNLLTKRFFILIAVGAIFLIGSVVSVNIFLASYKSKLVRYLSVNFRAPVAIASVTYDFPDKVSLNRIRVFKNIHGANRPALVIKRIYVPFDLGKLLFKRIFSSRRAYVQGCEIFSRETGLFWRENGKYIKNFFASFSGGKRFIVDTDGVVSFYSGGSNAKRVSFYNTTVIRDGFVDTFGGFELGQRFADKPVSYSANMQLNDQGADIKALKVVSDGFYSTLWGRFNGGQLELSGYSQNVPPILPSKPRKGLLSIYESHARGATLLGSEQDVWNIYDIDLSAGFMPAGIHIDHLIFSVNNTQLRFAGDLFFGDSVKVDVTCDTGRLNVAVKGKILNNIFNGTSKIVSMRSVDGSDPLREETNIVFDDLCFQSLDPKAFKLHCGGLLYEYNAVVAAHKLEFRNFNLTADLTKREKSFEADADLYDGFCGFKGIIDLSRAIFFDCDIGITAVTTKNMRSLLTYFNSIDGKVSGKMHYRAGENGDFSGHLIMDSGSLHDFTFFTWLARTFSLDDLRNIDFTRLSLDFFVAKNSLKMENIKLISPQIGLDGYYNIDADMVSSKISLSLSRLLLKKSSKFNPLVAIVGSDFNQFTFDFQLSGFQSSVNFKWLNSEFKNRLKSAIPGFIERGIERKVEDIIASSVEKNQ